MSIDALKFFQAYINEMNELGGENLPKSISSRLGAKLAKIYKIKGISEIESGLKHAYYVLNSSTKIIKKDNNNYEIINKFKHNFCPIGGKYNPNAAPIVQESICRPYTMGFLNEMDPGFKYSIDPQECILTSNKKICRYSLHLEKKENNSLKNKD